MNIVFLVGNGFDQKLHLHTAPADFISAFVGEYANEHADKPENRLAKHIQDEGIKTWAAFEEKLGEYSHLFTLKDKDQYLEQSSALVSHLDSWLEKEQAEVSSQFVNENAARCMESTASFQDGLPALQKKQIGEIWDRHRNESVVVDFLCFNYTDCLFRLYRQAGGKGAVIKRRAGNHVVYLGDLIHVHDSLQGHIVCGVNSPEQISNPELRNDSRVVNTIVKSSIQENVLYSDSHQRGFHAISRASIIAVFGMSYGITDRRWWERILARMKRNPEVVLVLFYYNRDSGKQNVFEIEARNRGEITRFFKGAGIDDLDESVVARIFVSESLNVFPIEGVIK